MHSDLFELPISAVSAAQSAVTRLDIPKRRGAGQRGQWSPDALARRAGASRALTHRRLFGLLLGADASAEDDRDPQDEPPTMERTDRRPPPSPAQRWPLALWAALLGAAVALAALAVQL